MAKVRAKQKKRFNAMTDRTLNFPVAPNLLQRHVTLSAPDRIYCSDITYLWTAEGWLYLAVIIDLFSREVVGWSLSKRMGRKLVGNALQVAIWRRRPLPNRLFHSDRGSHYCRKDFQKFLRKNQMKSSKSRQGHC
ncbi:hypothetical protein CSA56_15065 [candidate division KSB3 bacterium]|uniref:Integrase catalytic domain-containing protein n=1 Tax=candidate division KSB3 bacterium TaxID=2044937 RepID=A0A2G6KA39_9BACT|nr:MAG: hypothetical protein CSA56_15065 [candidate division KSB3 bacterium]